MPFCVSFAFLSSLCGNDVSKNGWLLFIYWVYILQKLVLVKESVISPIKDLFVVLVAFNPVDLKMKDKYSRDR